MSATRIALLSSGGDAPGMNSAIRAVTRKALHHGLQVYGVRRGYQGLITGDFFHMTANSVANIINQGGTMLKTARCEEFKTPEGFAAALEELQHHKIDVTVVIGGEGSMAGAVKLAAAGVNTIVIPATIDNDMPGTDYALGFDTCLNTILDAVSKIRDTASSHERVAVVELMGRNSGQLALHAGLACGAEVVFAPEMKLDMDEVCKRLSRSHARGKLYSIVLVAEGYGKGEDIAAKIAAGTGLHCPVTVLGYIQRGGSPSAMENIMGSQMGAKAVDAILEKNFNTLISYSKGELSTVPLKSVNDTQKKFDTELYQLVGILAQ